MPIDPSFDITRQPCRHRQIHAPARGATRSRTPIRVSPSSFNPRARAGRDRLIGRRRCRTRCFSPRARVGRDLRGHQASPQHPVSIRAPTWGATIDVHLHRDRHIVQIHAPRGARPISARTSSRASCFNPRARAGRDSALHTVTTWPASFNPRARAGRDTPSRPASWQSSMFQSTRPRGARPVPSPPGCPRHRFNPRARAGRDRRRYGWRQALLVSIHAPARGATRPQDRAHAYLGFQSTRPRGARHFGNEIVPIVVEFQSTRPRGARRCPKINLQRLKSFQSTRPRGARRYTGSIPYPSSQFQSTRPRGARPRR